MLIDANLLLFAVNEQAHRHDLAAEWLTRQLNGGRRVGLPWQTLGAFLRIATNPRAFRRPLAPVKALEVLSNWLSAPVAWIPQPGAEYHRVLGQLITTYNVSGNLITDAMLAALAIEHGLTLYSADTDFARFRELRWENPLA
jgi:toxin-antitoxin system PIN domain toxin